MRWVIVKIETFGTYFFGDDFDESINQIKRDSSHHLAEMDDPGH
jgi:hypothetical protein